MKTIKVTTEFEVQDDFCEYEALSQYMHGTMDNAPEPEDVDELLEDVEVGISYIKV